MRNCAPATLSPLAPFGCLLSSSLFMWFSVVFFLFLQREDRAATPPPNYARTVVRISRNRHNRCRARAFTCVSLGLRSGVWVAPRKQSRGTDNTAAPQASRPAVLGNATAILQRTRGQFTGTILVLSAESSWVSSANRARWLLGAFHHRRGTSGDR